MIKWLDDQADGNAKEDEEDVGADADEALASGAELLRRSGIVLGDQILDEEEEKEEEDEDVAELQSPYRERVRSKFPKNGSYITKFSTLNLKKYVVFFSSSRKSFGTDRGVDWLLDRKEKQLSRAKCNHEIHDKPIIRNNGGKK